MNSVLKVVKDYAKAIGAFVAGVVLNMVVNLVNGTAVWPQTGAQWLQYVGTSFGTAIVVLLAPNTITDKQIAKDPTVTRVVVPDLPTLPPGQRPWRQ